MRKLARKECSICTSGLENQSRTSTLPLDFPKIFDSIHPLLLHTLISEHSQDLLRVLNGWTASSTVSSMCWALSLHKHHSSLLSSSSYPQCTAFILVRRWLIRSVPLLPASCDLLLCIGEGAVEELCRSSAASCTASLLHLHKIDSGFLVKHTGQDWLSFHLHFDWIGLSWLSSGRIGRFFFFLIFLWRTLPLFVKERCSWRAEWFVFEVSAPYDWLLWGNGDGPMCLSAQHLDSKVFIVSVCLPNPNWGNTAMTNF